MKHKPSTATALFFDELRPEANQKMSCMGLYSDTLYLLNPDATPVDRLAILAIAHWDFDTAPLKFLFEIILPSETRAFPIELPEPAPPRPTSPSPFAGLSVKLPLNLRIAPLVDGDVVEVWLAIQGTADEQERYPMARLNVKSTTQQVAASAQPVEPPTGKTRRAQRRSTVTARSPQ